MKVSSRSCVGLLREKELRRTKEGEEKRRRTSPSIPNSSRTTSLRFPYISFTSSRNSLTCFSTSSLKALRDVEEEQKSAFVQAASPSRARDFPAFLRLSV